MNLQPLHSAFSRYLLHFFVSLSLLPRDWRLKLRWIVLPARSILIELSGNPFISTKAVRRTSKFRATVLNRADDDLVTLKPCWPPVGPVGDIRFPGPRPIGRLLWASLMFRRRVTQHAVWFLAPLPLRSCAEAHKMEVRNVLPYS